MGTTGAERGRGDNPGAQFIINYGISINRINVRIQRWVLEAVRART
jgi:hypothetical protein